MNLDLFFKSIITLDNTMIIICDLNHKIVYLNDIAKKNRLNDNFFLKI